MIGTNVIFIITINQELQELKIRRTHETDKSISSYRGADILLWLVYCLKGYARIVLKENRINMLLQILD